MPVDNIAAQAQSASTASTVMKSMTLRFRDAQEHALISKAAELDDRSLNNFIVAAARARAEQLLAQSLNNGSKRRKSLKRRSS